MSHPRPTHSKRVLLLFTLLLLGCNLGRLGDRKIHEEPPVCEPPLQREIETPVMCEPMEESTVNLAPPLTIDSDQPPEDWYLTLQEVVQMTLANSDVIRDLGGRVVGGAPSTVYDVALQELGVEAALSDFDARVASTITFNKDERAFNNLFFGGGATTVASNTANYAFEISKTGATGSQYAIRNITGYNRNSVPSNLFSSAYDTAMEAEMRHPILRGGGLEFNRIAGPNAGVGVYGGVLLARIRTDIALADFESSVRDLIRDAEDAYWQLYFAYRNLDARTAAYEAALTTWRKEDDRFQLGQSDGNDEAFARASYYQAKAAMQNALSGGNGEVGVYVAERNLRVIMGIPANDGRLIRPGDEPSVAERIFVWRDSLELALDRRVELRRQRWVVKQREKELTASRNFLLSQLDFVGLYRWRGFGDELLGNRDVQNGSAVSDLWAGNLQGWQLGLQYSTTIGKRREHAAVRSAELQLARARATLRNQELLVSNELSNQYSELDRIYALSRDNLNRSIAERQRLTIANARFVAGSEPIEFLVDAQQNTATADSDYYRSLVDYNLAVSDLHYARGTYLDYMGVRLSEGPWTPDAYPSYRKEFRRFKPRLNYCRMEPGPVSAGVYSQVAPVTSGLPEETLPMQPQLPTEVMPVESGEAADVSSAPIRSTIPAWNPSDVVPTDTVPIGISR